MNRSDLTPILADIAETMDRVRDLDIEGHARAAALQCLADAKAHLEHVRQPGQPMAVRLAVQRLPIQTSPFPQAALDSVPPPATDNQRKRSEADEAFRASRRILREVLK